MILQNKKRLILTSLVILLPMAVGLLVWEKLPQVEEGWNPSLFAVFGPSLTMLAAHWICILAACLDRSNDDRNHKVQGMVLWICPMLSLFVNAVFYSMLLGAKFNMANLMVVFLGLLFAVIGNYLPKCRMNSTIGIKVPWAYTSEENWNATHRLGGKLWTVGGIVMILCAFLPGDMGIIVTLLGLIPLIVVPTVYSWQFYKKEKASGKALLPFYGTTDPRLMKGSLIAVLVILAGVCFLMFSGNIQVQYGDDAFTIEASYYDDLTVSYDSIDDIEYREENLSGSRTMGFASARLLMGYFENEELGTYTRYTYTNPGACILLTVGEKTLVLSGRDEAETQAIYQELLAWTAVN
ncbi:MAG: SdpI family protein [Oscillospiraceae bacterium]|nr:SdpI family protein [Oscillospiraceae bacterium]